jgi:hypothetical protein
MQVIAAVRDVVLSIRFSITSDFPLKKLSSRFCQQRHLNIE